MQGGIVVLCPLCVALSADHARHCRGHARAVEAGHARAEFGAQDVESIVRQHVNRPIQLNGAWSPEQEHVTARADRALSAASLSVQQRAAIGGSGFSMTPLHAAW